MKNWILSNCITGCAEKDHTTTVLYLYDLSLRTLYIRFLSKYLMILSYFCTVTVLNEILCKNFFFIKRPITLCENCRNLLSLE